MYRSSQAIYTTIYEKMVRVLLLMEPLFVGQRGVNRNDDRLSTYIYTTELASEQSGQMWRFFSKFWPFLGKNGDNFWLLSTYF